MSTKIAFALGPLASPFVVVLIVIFVSLASGLQDGIIGLIKTASIFFFVSLAYSYIFSFIFGLPTYIYFIKKGWVNWLGFNIGAVVSTAILGLVMVILGQVEHVLMYIVPIAIFAIFNANLMWYIINKTANKRIQATAKSAAPVS